MLDLKSKLLAAGLITKEQFDKQNQPKKNIKKPISIKQHEHLKQVNHLKSLSKSEQYDLIRKWVQRNRLDKELTLLSESAEKFFFNKADDSISWLTLEKDLIEKIHQGNAAIMAFMSHNGLSHCVIDLEIAQDVKEVFPTWIRVLINKNEK